jgi:flagellar hook assembly protein FlgD
MRKNIPYKFLFSLLLAFVVSNANAQFKNSWIDYNKTYYKIKVGQTGLYRIPYSVLQSIGISSADAASFQLWKNGQEVPLFISIPTGILSASDYIEFFGEINDGKLDEELYSRPGLQLANKWSLQTDTSVYFLTINTASANKRLVATQNNVALNTLPVEPYFNYTFSKHYKDQINPGYASVVGTTFIYSSSYDAGEGWSSRNITPATPLVEQQNYFVAPGGPAPAFRINAYGTASNNRRFQVMINGTMVVDNAMNFFTPSIVDITLPANLIGRNIDTVRIINSSAVASDRMAAYKYEITYPRLFNFGGSSLFEFELPASSLGNYLEIVNFNAGNVAPILYELNEGKRYIADNSEVGKLKFALAAGGNRRFVLISATATFVQSVSNITRKNFVDYSVANKQADFLIIAHSSLNASSKGDAIQQYANYRSSVDGGSYKVGVYDIDELVDQFAFGIKKHPLSIKNFIAFARASFTNLSPKFILLMGKGVTYDQYRINEFRPSAERLNIVPTYGNPGSDNLLSSSDYDPTPETPIGRISVTSGDEILAYLDKVKQHDQALKSTNQTISEKAWMKNVAHVIGGGDPYLQGLINGYMNSHKNILMDSAFGAKVYTFEKITPAGNELVNSGLLGNLFKEGLSLITYFGHSSSSSMEYNLDDPTIYSNDGKYPLFIANGCNAGNFFAFDTLRISGARRAITENYILAPNKGSIGFLASTHLGVVNYLNNYTNNFYNKISRENYTSPIGVMQTNVLRDIANPTGTIDFFNQITVEQLLLNGDPAVTLYPHPVPDYVVEDPLVRVSPINLNVTYSNFNLDIKYQNIGRVSRDSLRVKVIRQKADGSETIVYNEMRKAVNHSDSVQLTLPIDPLKDRGQNKIIVTLDPELKLEEISKSNNTITKSFVIADDDVRPAYPAEFAIVNIPALKLKASTSKFLSSPAEFLLELDTTALFDSPFKLSQKQLSAGGVIEFSPSFQMRDSSVYYWRVAKKPDTGTVKNWATSSFVYLPNSSPGWSQSHYYQFLKNTNNRQAFNGRQLEFDKVNTNVNIRTGIFPSVNSSVAKDLTVLRTTGCGTAFGSLEFLIFNQKTGNPARNVIVNNSGLYNSFYLPVCYPTTQYQFNFSYNTAATRKNAMDFLDQLAPGNVVVMINWSNGNINNRYIDFWKQDTTLYGSGNSLYHKLKSVGFSLVDSFYKNVPLLMIAIKDELGNWQVQEQKVGSIPSEILTANYSFQVADVSGKMTSVKIGPAKSWNSILWDGRSLETPSVDQISYKIYGVSLNQSEQLLYESLSSFQDTSISNINANDFPYLRIEKTNTDLSFKTPDQPKYLQVKYNPVPEGAIVPAAITSFKDTVETGEKLKLSTAFRNISDVAFDSIKVIMSVTDETNQTKTVLDTKKRPIPAGDSIVVDYLLDTKDIKGVSSVLVNFNPDFAQSEQYLFNNYQTIPLSVTPDKTPPNLDVTFDGIRILNKDIVSAKPFIVMTLKDDSKFLALNDTSLFSVKLRTPDGNIRNVRFDGDTLKFIPASLDAVGKENAATVHYRPHLIQDGEYELIVFAKDRSNNPSGSIDYSVAFEVVNKSMISNLLNYPNPFTTSTAFVFTLTGSELPSQFRIQILTITGKIVKEINKEELGPIRIGNNITEYKWDGRDQFGQPLANGVYLYRVVANMNGKKIEKLNTGTYNTDKYFRSGYGKMYLMR